jgi:hypothetical protein
MITTILTDRTNYQAEIDEAKQAWLGDVLHYLGADLLWLDSVDRDLAVEYFIQNDLEVIRHTSIDALEVKYEGEVVGEWGGPTFTLKEDHNGVLYFEIDIEHWSIIEEDIEEDI